MCGIAGILRITPPPSSASPGAARANPAEPHEVIPEAWLDALDAGIAWRGPDGAGRFRDRMTRPDGTIVDVAFVHRRLSIIDIEGGAQPMTLGECPACRAAAPREQVLHSMGWEPHASAHIGRLTVVFNGCIYNSSELRTELEAKGHSFATHHSDTEVILHHINHILSTVGEVEDSAEESDDFEEIEAGYLWYVHKLRGMFAAAIWSPSSGSLCLIQDDNCEKPIYCAHLHRERVIVFASSPRGVNDALALICRDTKSSPHASPRPIAERTMVDWIAMGFSKLGTPYQLVTPIEKEHRWLDRFDESVQWGLIKRKFMRARNLTILGAVLLLVLATLGFLLWAVYIVVTGILSILVSAGLVWIALKLPVPWIASAAIRKLRKRATPRPPAEQEFEEILELAVAQRLEADVPLGCFLSGGIDSSLIALMASRHVPNLVTLSMRMPDERYDESRYAEMVARHLGTNHHSLNCDSRSAADDLIRLIDVMGLPFGDSSILPTYWLCREARKHVKVALAGDGGDEMFYGYDRYKAARYLRWPMRWLAAAHPMGSLDRTDPTSMDERKARLITAARHGGYLDLLAIFPTPDRIAFLGHSGGSIAGKKYISPSVSAMRQFDLSHYLPGDLMRKVDTASMLAGVEVRSPFLAPEIRDFAMRQSIRTHMRNGETKHILKQIARKHLPREIIDRPKQGFAIPISDWFRTNFGGLGELMLDRLSRERPFGAVHETLPINMPFVRQMIDEHWAAGGLTPKFTTQAIRPRDHGQRLFMLLSLSLWSDSLA